MIDILATILRKIGKQYTELKPPAKAAFDEWEKILTTGPVTIEKLKEFLEGQKDIIIMELANSQHELNSKEDMYLKARLFDCIMILTIFDSPEKASKQIENYLKKLHGMK